MARLVSLAGGSTTVCNLDECAFWRIKLGAVGGANNSPQMALCWIHPPGTPAELVALARAELGITSDGQAVQQIAEVCLAGGSLEEDMARTEEGFHLLKNQARPPSQELLHLAVKATQNLVSGYWEIRGWIEQGMAGVREVTFADGSRIICQP